MLDHPFPGHALYREQLRGIAVVEAEGHLEFKIGSAVPPVDCATARYHALVEARFLDDDGVPASFILHEKDGRLWMLERFKADSSRIIAAEPSLSILEIVDP